MKTRHWQKTPKGYALDGHTLYRSGRSWRLRCVDGEEINLGTRATFDHAEQAISRRSEGVQS